MRALINFGKKCLWHMGFYVMKAPYAPLKVRELRFFSYFERMFHAISGVPGDIVECGVYRGKTLLMLAHLALQGPMKPFRMVWGFDSFQGLPQASPEDASYRRLKKGEPSDTTPERVLKFLNVSGLPGEFIQNQIRLVPGFFNESLKQFPDRSIALLHLDCDLYQSYLDALTALFPKVAKGGIVLFDEYRQPSWPGAEKAIDEYFTTHQCGSIQYDERIGRYFAVKQ